MGGHLFVFQICGFGFICRYFPLSPMYGVMASYYGCFFSFGENPYSDLVSVEFD